MDATIKTYDVYFDKDINSVVMEWHGYATSRQFKEGTELMLNTAYEKQDRPSTPDELRMASHRDTTIYFGCPDVDTAYDHITSKGMNIKPPYITGYGFKAIDITDPDGYGLCFHWPS